MCVDEWSKEDCLTLLERIRSLLPDGDGMKYKTTESHFDWDKVCFGSFTGDMCRQKWQKVSTEVAKPGPCGCSHPSGWLLVTACCCLQVRKYRTMTELIVDAIEFVKNPYKGKKLKVRLERCRCSSQDGWSSFPTCSPYVLLTIRLIQISQRSL